MIVLAILMIALSIMLIPASFIITRKLSDIKISLLDIIRSI